MIESVGVSQAFIYWGLIVTAMIVIGACLIHQGADRGAVHETKTEEYTTKEMLGTKQVYLLFIMLFTSCMSGLYLIGMVKDIGVQLVGLSAKNSKLMRWLWLQSSIH